MVKPVMFKTQILKLQMFMNVNYLLIPKSVVHEFGGISKTRLFCEVNKKIKFQCGMMPLNNGQAYITLNKQRMKELGLKTGDFAKVTLQVDSSKYGMEISDELKEILKQDPEGNERFHKLSPGKQRNIIFYVDSVKSSQLKIDRAIKLLTNLKNCPPEKETMRRIFGIAD